MQKKTVKPQKHETNKTKKHKTHQKDKKKCKHKAGMPPKNETQSEVQKKKIQVRSKKVKKICPQKNDFFWSKTAQTKKFWCGGRGGVRFHPRGHMSRMTPRTPKNRKIFQVPDAAGKGAVLKKKKFRPLRTALPPGRPSRRCAHLTVGELRCDLGRSWLPMGLGGYGAVGAGGEPPLSPTNPFAGGRKYALPPVEALLRVPHLRL